MAEQRFLCTTPLAAASRLPNSNRTGIEINWREALAKTIEIAHHHIEMATKSCCVNLKPGCRRGEDEQLALDAQTQMFFTSTQRRWRR